MLMTPIFLHSFFQVMKSGSVANVPIMLGFTKEDGLLTTASLLKNPQLFKELRYLYSFTVYDKTLY
jgi:hypothetical protein